MAINLSSLKRAGKIKPPRITVYGVQGVGKTTFGTCAPSPVVIQTEDGLGNIDVDHFPLARSFEDVMEAIGSLYEEDHEFKTLVIDSLDWLEPLVWSKACRENKWNSIEDPGYGRGYVAALTYWRDYIDGINLLRDDKGMTIIQTAHSQVRRFDSPLSDPYDRYEIKLHKSAASLLQEHSDIVLFMNYNISTVKAEAGFNKKVTRAIGSGKRVLYTEERPAFHAKNRFSMPDMITLPDDPATAWAKFAEHLPK
jgi:hypothetical protein